MSDYELINHTADIGIKVKAGSLPELFEKCALALFDIITDLEKVRGLKKIEFQIEEESIEDLLIRFLNELLYYFGAKNFLGCEFKVELIEEGKRMKAKIKGEKANPQIHSIKTEVKAATYHEFELKKIDSQYIAKIIFDI